MGLFNIKLSYTSNGFAFVYLLRSSVAVGIVAGSQYVNAKSADRQKKREQSLCCIREYYVTQVGLWEGQKRKFCKLFCMKGWEVAMAVFVFLSSCGACI